MTKAFPLLLVLVLLWSPASAGPQAAQNDQLSNVKRKHLRLAKTSIENEIAAFNVAQFT